MRTVVGLYDDIDEAHRVVEALDNAGFDRDQISLIAGDQAEEYAPHLQTDTEYDTEGDGAGGGAAAGAGIGAILGGLGGLLVGLGALAIPGIGPVIAAGPIVATLIGAGAGAVAGGLVGALVDAGVPEEQAGYYAEGVRRGSTLVVVKTADERSDDAMDIMNRYNPVDIERRARQWKEEGWEGYDEEAEPYTSEEVTDYRDQYRVDEDRDVEREDTMEVVEEELRVGKREVERGGVRVRSYVTEEPVEENVTLRDEKIRVERRDADRPADESDFDEDVIELHETDEEVVVEKKPRVVGEVHVEKDVDTRQETIRETLRRKDVDVEELGDGWEDWEEQEPVFQRHYTSMYSTDGEDYAYYRPAYMYGYELGQDERYQDRQWRNIEPEARREWESSDQDADWIEVRDAVHEGWKAHS